MGKTQFVYVTYIAATPERVFAALTDTEFTRQYWEAENVSDWNVGSAWSTAEPTRRARSPWWARCSRTRRRAAWC